MGGLSDPWPALPERADCEPKELDRPELRTNPLSRRELGHIFPMPPLMDRRRE